MNRSTLRAVAPILVLSLAIASRAWADCATYISTGFNDAPNTGRLIGTSTVTETVTETWSLNASLQVPGKAGFSGSGSYSKTTTTTYTYEIGYYEMKSGEIWAVDCRTYTRI